jgi:hypothetical protein
MGIAIVTVYILLFMRWRAFRGGCHCFCWVDVLPLVEFVYWQAAFEFTQASPLCLSYLSSPAPFSMKVANAVSPYLRKEIITSHYLQYRGASFLAGGEPPARPPAVFNSTSLLPANS